MQMPIHQIVGMIAVGYGLVAAVGPMTMPLIVNAASVRGRTLRHVASTYPNRMLVNVVAVHVVQVPVVKIVGMSFVLDRGMPALGTVDVGVILVNLMSVHVDGPLRDSVLFVARAKPRWRGPER